MEPQPDKMTIVCGGKYPAEMPEDLKAALLGEMERHLQSYGLTDTWAKITAKKVPPPAQALTFNDEVRRVQESMDAPDCNFSTSWK